jgi:6-phosphogluconolactonase
MPTTVSSYSDFTRLLGEAADLMVREIERAVSARGRAWVVLAGGETPRALYTRLAAFPAGLPWEKIWWCLGDERWVPRADPLSNFAMVDHALFSRAPIPRDHILAVPTHETDPAAGARAYEAALRAHFPRVPWPAFDVALMGLGADGHTAALFPGDPALAERAAWVTTTRAGKPVPDRVTLTVPVFSRARWMVFVVSGSSKASAVAATLGGSADPERWPAQAVMPPSGRCLWLLDQGAADSLPADSRPSA